MHLKIMKDLELIFLAFTATCNRQLDVHKTFSANIYCLWFFSKRGIWHSVVEMSWIKRSAKEAQRKSQLFLAVVVVRKILRSKTQWTQTPIKVHIERLVLHPDTCNE